jgi:hypothetical protein
MRESGRAGAAARLLQMGRRGYVVNPKKTPKIPHARSSKRNKSDRGDCLVLRRAVSNMTFFGMRAVRARAS